MNEALQFGYARLPRNWAKENWETLEIPDSRVAKISEALGRIPKGTELFVHNNCGVVVRELLKKFQLSQISGVDFVEYFKGAMGKSEPLKIVEKDIVVIYNLGLEPAINLTFSAKLLKGLLKQLEQYECIVILQSDTPYSKISREYEIEFSSKITIPYIKHKALL